MVDESSEDINLGDKIQLSGFKIINSGELIVIRKIVGSQVRKFQEFIPDFERLVITLKPVHKTEKNMQYELHAKIIHGGKPVTTEAISRNLFMGISTLFHNFEAMLNKK